MQPQKIVTYLWLEDCFDSCRVVEFKYFHRPIVIDLKLRPCQGVVIGINYVGQQRQYITSLAEALGKYNTTLFFISPLGVHIMLRDLLSQKFMHKFLVTDFGEHVDSEKLNRQIDFCR
jgi:hypothetical protein